MGLQPVAVIAELGTDGRGQCILGEDQPQRVVALAAIVCVGVAGRVVGKRVDAEVGALAAVHGVAAGPADQDVGAVAAIQRIVAGPAIERVAAVAAYQDVVTGPAGQHVGAVAAVDGIAAGTSENGVAAVAGMDDGATARYTGDDDRVVSVAEV